MVGRSSLTETTNIAERMLYCAGMKDLAYEMQSGR